MSSADFQHTGCRELLLNSRAYRLVAICILALLFAVGWVNVHANAETRTLKMYFTHTKESATITFKKNGKYLPGGLKKANRFLRDWRRKEPTKMDPALLDLVWEVYQKSGSRKPIKVISGYRSPRTNNMLRRRGRKVAKKSQHTMGKALDFFLQDVSVAKLRGLGLKAHRGGVGYYAGSFVHLDTGRVRHWPRMSHSQLSRVFPKGKTIHIPSNGKPLKGYKVARANLQRGLNADGSKRTTKVRKTLLAGLFKNDATSTADEDEGGVVKRREAKRPKLNKPVPTASLQRKRKKPDGPDPFSLENKAVETQPNEAKPAGSAELALAQLAPNQVAVPVQRPRRAGSEEIPTNLSTEPNVTLSTASTTVPGSESQLSRAAPRQLALATPTSLPQALRPPVNVPGVPVPPTSVSAEREEVDVLRSRIQTALARGRTRSPVELATRQLGARQAVTSSSTVPVPKAPVGRSTSTQLALAAIPEPAPRRVAALVPEQSPNVEEKVVVDKSRFEVSRVTDPTIPSWRNNLNEEMIAAAASRLRVPLPTASPIREDREAIIASSADTSVSDGAYALSLGDLDGSSVKEWAVSISTRIGPAAVLTAPNYKQSTQQVAPKSVYSAGFAPARFILRADRFSGRSLTRVAFATFDRNN